MRLARMAFDSAPSLGVMRHSFKLPNTLKRVLEFLHEKGQLWDLFSSLSVSLINFSFLLVSKPRIGMGASFTTKMGCF